MAIDDFGNFENSDTVYDAKVTNNLKESYLTENNNVILTSKQIGTDYNYKHQIVWTNAIGFLVLHTLALWVLFIYITGGIKLQTYVWSLLLIFLSTEGATIGSHRLFAHRSFKATPLLKAVLILWHNYHHAFPWDYKAAELSTHFNQSGKFIKFFEKIGLAYDLKTAGPEMVTNRTFKTGDGTHYALGSDEAKSSVTSHPLNPSYNVKYKSPAATLEDQGLPLFHETEVFSFTLLKKSTTA